MAVTQVEAFMDPSCPWAWITSRWLLEVAPHRDLTVRWRSYCIEIRDDYGVAATVPDEYRDVALAGHAASHQMLRVFEAARADGGQPSGEEAVDRLYAEWGKRYFAGSERPALDGLVEECVAAAGLDNRLAEAALQEKWDAPIRASMEEAYRFAGEKTQTPAIVVRAQEPYGFKGPVMAPAPTGDEALRLWDALTTIAQMPGFFEVTRPRVNSPRDHLPD